MITPLCRCNNCMSLMIDNNPKDNAHKFDVPKELLQLEKNSNGFWQCPKCETDQYLSDVGLDININLSSEEDVYYIISKLIKWCEEGVQDSISTKDEKARKMFVHFRKTIFNELSSKQ